MITTRETIYQALFELVSAAPGIVYASRVFKLFNDVPPERMPALFQVQNGERAEQTRGLPTKWRMEATLWLYVQQNEDDTVPASATLNPLIDYIVGALGAPLNATPENVQTLGGLVHRAWVSGDANIETFEGFFQNVTVATIPVLILTA